MLISSLWNWYRDHHSNGNNKRFQEQEKWVLRNHESYSELHHQRILLRNYTNNMLTCYVFYPTIKHSLEFQEISYDSITNYVNEERDVLKNYVVLAFSNSPKNENGKDLILLVIKAPIQYTFAYWWIWPMCHNVQSLKNMSLGSNRIETFEK